MEARLIKICAMTDAFVKRVNGVFFSICIRHLHRVASDYRTFSRFSFACSSKVGFPRTGLR